MALCNNGTRMPSPQEAANGFPQPCASGTWHNAEEESRTTEPNLVKKAHREILDHERKRRVELKCMELQEMMEEQGYSEEEICQKVGTFRQMLMEKEGVLTREDQHGRQIVIENHYMVPGEESATEYSMYGEGYTLECDCHSDWYQDDSTHRDYRTKRRLSSSMSPPPKKRKKKKSSHKRSRWNGGYITVGSCDSSSPVRKEKKKKSSKKHKRDRSNSGSRKKRRHRSRSPRNKKKDKIKDRKRSHSGSTTRRTHRHSSCSSHSASPSSDYSTSKSPSRQSPKHRQDDRKPSSQRSSRSVSSSCTGHSRSATPHHNGHKSGNHNGHHSEAIGNLLEKHLDEEMPLSCGSVQCLLQGFM
uniref:Serine/arginine repetitive matrix 3 n=1 Tax=Xenopus tropicalis TaxID=8364 RepID=A0A6I8PL16_XENTR